MVPGPGHLTAETASESQPLLSPSQIEEAGLIPSQLDNAADEHDPSKQKDELTWRWYGFYGLLLILGILVVSLLIKGFIDAGDKDVSGAQLLSRFLL